MDETDLQPSLMIGLPMTAITEFCRRWKVVKLEVFGSALRDDFGPHSDVDLLVTFHPEARWTLFDLVHAETELSSLVCRPVDLVERQPIEQSENWLRRRAILESAKTVYVA